MAKKNIKKIVEEKLEGFLLENNLELWNVEFIKEIKDWFLRVYIDKIDSGQGSVSLEECEKVSRFLSEILDEDEPIEQNYFLEVSSPGLERELITDRHFRKFVGSPVEVKLYKGVNGKKTITGILSGFTDEVIIIKEIEDDKNRDDEKEIRKSEIAKVHLVFFI